MSAQAHTASEADFYEKLIQSTRRIGESSIGLKDHGLALIYLADQRDSLVKALQAVILDFKDASKAMGMSDEIFEGFDSVKLARATGVKP
jgi:hypothetical protein